jgi:hypothetical protein
MGVLEEVSCVGYGIKGGVKGAAHLIRPLASPRFCEHIIAATPDKIDRFVPA